MLTLMDHKIYISFNSILELQLFPEFFFSIKDFILQVLTAIGIMYYFYFLFKKNSFEKIEGTYENENHHGEEKYDDVTHPTNLLYKSSLYVKSLLRTFGY